MKARADLSQDLIALDGKPLRRSLDRADGQGPMHVWNAWASAHEMVRAPVNVAAKTHELPALPEVLRRLNRSGAKVTIEARGGAGEIARKRQAQGADYGLR